MHIKINGVRTEIEPPHRERGQWAYFYALGEALDGRKVRVSEHSVPLVFFSLTGGKRTVRTGGNVYTIED